MMVADDGNDDDDDVNDIGEGDDTMSLATHLVLNVTCL